MNADEARLSFQNRQMFLVLLCPKGRDGALCSQHIMGFFFLFTVAPWANNRPKRSTSMS